ADPQVREHASAAVLEGFFDPRRGGDVQAYLDELKVSARGGPAADWGEGFAVLGGVAERNKDAADAQARYKSAVELLEQVPAKARVARVGGELYWEAKLRLADMAHDAGRAKDAIALAQSVWNEPASRDARVVAPFPNRWA